MRYRNGLWRAIGMTPVLASLLAITGGGSFASAAPRAAAAAPMPVTGGPVPASMTEWVTTAEQIMRAHALPGASLAVAFEGRVVLEEGLGYSYLATRTPVQPDAIFRLASVSKPITAALIGMLIDEHKLSLSTRPFATVLSGLRGPHGSAPVDPRLKDITIGDLLVHAGGWDINPLGYDPTFDAAAEEHALGLHSAPTCEQAIDYMLSVRLNFTPGTRSVYSNFGYCVLSDTIAHVTHLTYAQTASTMLFKPLRMTRTALSPSNPGQLLPGEVHFYGQGSEVTGSQNPYALNLLASQGAGSWTSTAPDLERFLIATSATLPGSEYYPAWPSGTVAGQQISGVSPPQSQQTPDPPNQGTFWAFDGSLPGTSTEIGVYGPITYVMLTNSRNPADGYIFGPLEHLATKEMTAAASRWPTDNLLIPPAVVHCAPASETCR